MCWEGTHCGPGFWGFGSAVTAQGGPNQPWSSAREPWGKNTSLCLSSPLYAPIPSPALSDLTQPDACLLSQEGLQVPLSLPRGSWPAQTPLCSASWDAVPRASSLSSPLFFFSDALCEKGVSLAPFCVFRLSIGVGVGEPLRGAVLCPVRPPHIPTYSIPPFRGRGHHRGCPHSGHLLAREARGFSLSPGG